MCCWQHSYRNIAITSYNGYHGYSEDDGIDHDKVSLLTYLLVCDSLAANIHFLLYFPADVTQ